AGQSPPAHYHMKKDETFHVLRGGMNVDIDDRQKVLEPGDSLWVPRGIVHAFGSDTGVIFEEISTTNHPDDSYYADKAISKLPRDFRKTYLLNWGRHQFD
ncbi:MAG: cupin domain-containing protein, partial [Patescibacteria group bacterium]